MPVGPRPPFDAELEAVLVVLGEQLPPSLTPEMIPMLRAANLTPTIEELLQDRDVEHLERTITGYQGAELVVSIFRRSGRTGCRRRSPQRPRRGRRPRPAPLHGAGAARLPRRPLGLRPQTPTGALRYGAARMLLRLASARW